MSPYSQSLGLPESSTNYYKTESSIATEMHVLTITDTECERLEVLAGLISSEVSPHPMEAHLLLKWYIFLLSTLF